MPPVPKPDGEAAEASASTGGHSHGPMFFIALALGSVAGLLILLILGFWLYKLRRRALRARKKSKLTGTGGAAAASGGHMVPPGMDEAKQRAMMGVKVPVRAHLDPGTPFAPPNGRGGGNSGAAAASPGAAPKSPVGANAGSLAAGFRWEDDDKAGMRRMMRKLSVS